MVPRSISFAMLCGVLGWTPLGHAQRDREQQQPPPLVLVNVDVTRPRPPTSSSSSSSPLDDIYHCRDPLADPEDLLIRCDNNTFEWILEDLSAEAPPEECDIEELLEQMAIMTDEDLDLDLDLDLDEAPMEDRLEPCLLWMMMFGDLAPSASPSMAPTTATPAPTPDENVIVLDSIFLTLQWFNDDSDIDGNRPPPVLQNIDIPTLRETTERHVLETLQTNLGFAFVRTANLIVERPRVLTASSARSTLRFELEGTVTTQRSSDISENRVQQLFVQSFRDAGLALYTFRLQISPDSILKQVSSVQMALSMEPGAVDFDALQRGDGANDDDDDDSDGFVMDTIMIAIIAAVGAAFFLVCCLIACLCLFARNPDYDPKAEFPNNVGGNTGSGGSRVVVDYLPHDGPKAPKNSNGEQEVILRQGPYRHVAVPPPHGAPSNALLLNRQQYYDDDDEENQMSLITTSAWGDDTVRGADADDSTYHPQDASLEGPYGNAYTYATEEPSVANSVYSYFNEEHSLLGGVASVANSFLYSIRSKRQGGTGGGSTVGPTSANGQDFYDYDYDDTSTLASSVQLQPKSKKKIWSVLDSLTRNSTSDQVSTNGDDYDDTTSSTSQRGSTPIPPPEEPYEMDRTSSRNSSMLGPDPEYEDQEPDLLPGETELAIETKPSQEEEDLQELEDYQSEMESQPPSTPVRERMEHMWAQDQQEMATDNHNDVDHDDDENTHKDTTPLPKQPYLEDDEVTEASVEQDYLSSLKMAAQTNLELKMMEGIQVYEDEDSSGGERSFSRASEESPASKILQETKIVNKLPQEQRDGEEEQDDNEQVGFQLPSQLMSTHQQDLDNMSHASSLSSRSGASGRSLNNSYGVANIRAQAALLEQQNSVNPTSSNASTASSSASIGSKSKKSVESSDSAKYRSLLNQGDTNDARLFTSFNSKSKSLEPGKEKESNETGSVQSSTSARSTPSQPSVQSRKSSNSAFRPGFSARRPSSNHKDVKKPIETKKSQPSSNNHQLSNLIKSFDEVWSQAEEDKDTISFLRAKKEKLPPVDSDEEDIYVEGGEDDEDEKSDKGSIKNGASKVVKELSSLLGDSSPSKNTTATAASTPDTERRLSFEIRDSSEEESSDDEEKKAEENHKATKQNMERLRRLSLSGYAETMASF